MSERKHRVTILVEGREIQNPIDYTIQSSIIHPADSFSIKLGWDRDVWAALPPDAEIRVCIDDVVVINGFIDGKRKSSKDRTISVHGRDRAGRLVNESAPKVNYDGMTIEAAVLKLVQPWFDKVTLSDVRNLNVRRGPGKKAKSARPAPLIPRQGNLLWGGKSVSRGKLHPGMTRWTAIEQILSDLGLMAWSSADGLEFFIGQPNQEQAPQYLFLHCAIDSHDALTGTVTDLQWEIDIGDYFSVISVVGTGGATEQDFGDPVSTRQASVYDNPDNTVDGTGAYFIHPKRMTLPEKDYDQRKDAADYASTEQIRRLYKTDKIEADAMYHGQWLDGQCTLFAPGTVGRVIDQDFDPQFDQLYLVTLCSYRGSRSEGETTHIELIPKGQKIIL